MGVLMVQNNDEPKKPSRRRKLARTGPSAHDLAEIAAATEGDFQLMHHEALEHFMNDRKGEALGLTRDALLRASERGGPFEAVAIISYLPILLTLAAEDTARQAARRAVLLMTGRAGCEYFVSYAHHYALQVEIRADDREAAYKEANSCIKAALRSDKHCTWLATAWRYIGMLQALRGEKMEAIVSLSNAVRSAMEKPCDDPLVLARSHDAAGQIMMDLRKWQLAEESFLNAIVEFNKQAPKGAVEAAETWKRAAKVREIRQGMGE
jgi:tetratricopeptide (TPR) repeat protein